VAAAEYWSAEGGVLRKWVICSGAMKAIVPPVVPVKVRPLSCDSW
jgi:hypothetical protein